MWLEPGLAPLSRWTDAILLVKATKWHKPFTDYSYDLVLVALCLLLLALGPGAYGV